MEITPKLSAGVIVLEENHRVAFVPFLIVFHPLVRNKTLGGEIFSNLFPVLGHIVGVEGIGVELAVLMQTTASGPARSRVFAVIGIAVAVNVVVRHFLNVDVAFHTILLALPTLVAIGGVISDGTGLLFVFSLDGNGTDFVDGAVDGNSEFSHIFFLLITIQR